MDWISITGLVLSAIAAIGAAVSIWALLIQRRQDKRSTELRDVSWVPRKRKEWTFTQVGSLPVSDVTIVLTIDDKASVHSFAAVAPKESVVTPNKGHRENLEYRAASDEEAENRRIAFEQQRAKIEERFSQLGALGSPAAALTSLDWQEQIESMDLPIKANVRAVISWRYPSGQSDRQQLEWTENY